MAHQTGESKQGCLRVDYDRLLNLTLHGSKVGYCVGLASRLDGSVEPLLRWFRRVLAVSVRHERGAWHDRNQFRQSVFGGLAVRRRESMPTGSASSRSCGGSPAAIARQTKQAASAVRWGFETELFGGKERFAADARPASFHLMTSTATVSVRPPPWSRLDPSDAICMETTVGLAAGQQAAAKRPGSSTVLG